MKVISGHCLQELRVRNSRFLAEAFPAFSQEEARALLKAQKNRYSDASHVVHAFVLGSTGSVCGCSDDGEPSGTAGRPVLDVLRGSGYVQCLVTVTRWFGGTLLGTGGLVQAYTDAAKAVLAACVSAELRPVRGFSVTLDYEHFERVRREIVPLGAVIENEFFDVVVRLTGYCGEDSLSSIQKRVQDLTAGLSGLVCEPEIRLVRLPLDVDLLRDNR